MWRVLLAGISILGCRHASALERVVSVALLGTARRLTVLEGSTRTVDVDGADEEPTTTVPTCNSYAEIPCSCEHVRFDEEGGRFKFGWDRFWHLPTLKRMLTVQEMYRRNVNGDCVYIAPHFWHSVGFGNFKSSLDVGALVVTTYGVHFGGACMEDGECLLSQAFYGLINWLVFMKQYALHPEDQDEAWLPVMEDMASPEATRVWRHAPWRLLSQRPGWAETLLYAVDTLDAHLAREGQGGPVAVAAGTPEVSRRLESALWRMAVGAKCADGFRELLEIAPRPADEHLLHSAAKFAFGSACNDLHPVKKMVLMLAVGRDALPASPEPPWPSLAELARAPFESKYARLCGGGGVGGVQHRLVGDVALHYVAADLAEVGGELQLDLLWMATSDDDCLMVGTNFHNQDGDARYYSFAHTLPAAHVAQWDCGVRLAGAPAEASPSMAASTGSFSGFLSFTTCRVPESVASELRTRAAAGMDAALEVWLSTRRGAWVPDPLRVCFLPRHPQRYLSACSATLHSADRIHAIDPHATEDWLNYHILVGIEHFTIFDTDGSYEPYLRDFIERGYVTYHPRYPGQISPKLGLLAAGLADPKLHRHMLAEPHALDACVWENRQVSQWVAVVHSFEEYIHSEVVVGALGRFNMRHMLEDWSQEKPQAAIFEMFQEPMGGEVKRGARSVLSRWTHSRGIKLDMTGPELLKMNHVHFQPFAWIVDPLNVMQTAVHFAQARADGQSVVVLPRELLRVNHYLDLGSNRSRCEEELGGCRARDGAIVWAEDMVVDMRRRGDAEPVKDASPPAPVYRQMPYGADGCPLDREVGSLEECVDAILALGLPTTPTWVGETPLVPSGCSVREASLGYGEHLHWNSARAGAGREDLAPVCRVAA